VGITPYGGLQQVAFCTHQCSINVLLALLRCLLPKLLSCMRFIQSMAFFSGSSDCCRQDYHVTLSAVRVPCQGPLELYQQAHAVVATGRPARAAVVDNSAVL
jgi:hypothetical protein